MTEFLTITDSAVLKVADIMSEEQIDTYLRVFVQGGGCSGFQYGFTFDEEKTEDDFVITKTVDNKTLNILVDNISFQYLNGATVDYKEDLNGSQFVITNPNAKTSCGCGSSFSA